MTIKSGEQHSDRTLYIVNLPVGCAPAMHSFPTVTSRQSSSPIGKGGNP